MAVTLSQTHYRFGKDDGTEAAHGWYADEDSPASLPLDTNCLLRINVQESGGSNANNLVQTFEFSTNGVTFSPVTTTSAPVRAVAVGAFANGANCTKRLSGTGTFEASGAGCTEDGSSGGNANDVAANGCTETELGFQILSAAASPGDAIRFRLAVSGPTTAIAYSVTPTAHIPISESPSVVATMLAGTTPSRVVNFIAAISVGALSMAGLQPAATVTVPDITIPATAGSMAVTGQTPKIPTLTAYLKDGGVTRATKYVSLTGSQATTEFELSTEERASIEAWGNLSLSLVANSGQVEVEWVELEAPSAATALSEAPGVGAIALTGLQPSASSSAPDITKSPGTASLALSGEAPYTSAFTVELRVGTDLVASRPLTLTGSLATYELDLTEGEASLITDWSDLRVSLTASGRQIEVAWVELNAPVAGPSFKVELRVGTDLVATRTVDLLGSLSTHEFALTAEEAGLITSWSTLRVSLIADQIDVEVAWVELETPESAGEVLREPATADVALVGLTPTATAAELSPLTALPGAGAMAISGMVPPSGTLDLYMGPSATGTLVATRALGFTDSLATYEFDLTDDEFASVTDWSNLHLVLTADGEQLTVSWLGVEAGERGAFPSAGSMSFAGGSLPWVQIIGQGASAAGALTMAGAAPTLDRTYVVAPPVGAMAVAGLAPTPVGIADPPVGRTVLAGLEPTLATGPVPMSIPVLVGTASLTGIAPTATQALAVSPGTGTLAMAGAAPTLDRTYLAKPAVRALTFTGPAPLPSVTSESAITVTPDVASLVFAGAAPSPVQAAVGPVALSWGSEALVIAGCEPGSLVSAHLTGDTLEYVT